MRTPVGIIRKAALWNLCRYRHNFHGCAFAAFVEQAEAEQGWPSSEATRVRAYRYYEEALAAKSHGRDWPGLAPANESITDTTDREPPRDERTPRRGDPSLSLPVVSVIVEL
jgi:hypothetical protein